MTPSEVRNAIFIRYLDTFSGQFPIALDNQAFNPPAISDGVKWVRVSVQFSDGTQDSLGRAGNRKFLKTGLLFVQVFTGADQATNDNDALAESSLNVFEGVRINDVWFNNGRIDSVGTDGEWYQQNVVFDFTFEGVK